MKYIRRVVDDDGLYQESNMLENESIVERKLIISKDEFVVCYKKWIEESEKEICTITQTR